MFAIQIANILEVPMQIQHLFLRQGCYQFVIRVPRDLLGHFPQKTLWRSLKTKDLKAAKILVKAREHEAEKIFMQIRTGLLSDDQIKRLVAVFLHGELSSIESERSTAHSLRHSLTSVEANIDFLSEMYGGVACAMQKDLARGDLAYGRVIADAIIVKNNLALSLDSDDYHNLCREVMKSEIKRLSVESRRTSGEYDSETERAAFSQYPLPKKRTRLSELINAYSEDRIFKKKWSSPKTITDMQSSYSLLLRVKGDFFLDEASYDFAREFRTTLQLIPANSNKGRFQGKSVAEILTMSAVTPMSISNYNKNIRRMAELFNFAILRDLSPVKNCFTGLEVSDPVKDSDKRRQFTLEEIKKVLSYLLDLLERKLVTDVPQLAITIDYVWIFLFGLYTGCRSNELCQLTIDDLLEICGIPCIAIKHDPDSNKSTKNKESRRVIPIPQQLICLGFLDFVDKQGSNANGRLWKSLSLDSFGKWNKNFGRNINGYIDAALGEADRTLCYHSTRHNLGNELKKNKIDLQTIQDIKGHAGKSTEERFYQDAHIEDQLAAFSKLEYGLDLQQIKEKLARLEGLSKVTVPVSEQP